MNKASTSGPSVPSLYTERAPRVLPRGHLQQSAQASVAPPPRYSDEAWMAERQGHIDQGRMTSDHFQRFCALFAITSPRPAVLVQALFRACRPTDGAAMSFQELLRGCVCTYDAIRVRAHRPCPHAAHHTPYAACVRILLLY